MRLDAADSLLLLVDVQAKLMPAIAGGDAVVDGAGRLARAAHRLEVPVVVTEQYPDGLGHTVPELAQAVGEARVCAKTAFDAAADPGIAAAVAAAGRGRLVLAGAEAHVCVLQTALGFAGKGYEVAVVADAVGSRTAENRDRALDRLAANGVEIVTREMVHFEWLGASDTPAFRELLDLVK